MYPVPDVTHRLATKEGGHMNSEKPKTEKPPQRKLKLPDGSLMSPKKKSHKAKRRKQVSIGFASIRKSDNSDDFI
jgi:hypothetical protein